MSGQDSMISIQHLSKCFGDNEVLKDVNIEIAKGEVVVKVADQRYTVNQKRLSPHLKKEQLYPDAENYDLSIVLDTVENRKAKNKMRKRHVEGAVVTVPGAPEERL